MNLQLYEKISKFETYYMIYKFTGKITEEELSKILNCNIKNIYNYITTSEVKLLEDFLNSGDHNEFITNCLKKEFSNMEPRDIANNIFEFFHAGIFDQSILDAIPEPAILLDYLDENNNDLYLFDIIDFIDPTALFNYINNDGKSKDKIIAEIYSNYEFISNINFIEDSLQHIYDDSDRTKLLIYSKLNQFLPYIENPYYRNQVINACTKFEFDENELVENMKLYQFHEQAIAKLKTEDDITEYISTIDDPDIKLTFLEPIKKKENRNTFQK